MRTPLHSWQTKEGGAKNFLLGANAFVANFMNSGQQVLTVSMMASSSKQPRVKVCSDQKMHPG